MDPIHLDNQFNKALRLLSFGETQKAMEILNELTVEAQEAYHTVLFIRASCVLGEMLFDLGEEELAIYHLQNVVQTPYKEDIDDQLDYEKSVATTILNQIHRKIL